ncbi:MAG TPA: sulfite exporter TauE/SafE family protein [Allosphingosinicella sp.]|nr:sulfite exporter TauE/SafE family protein [Allosphingosinicella sp.]
MTTPTDPSSAVAFGLLLAAGFVGGLFNALAGGGSIFTFPALMLTGIPPLAANITNSVALCPGYFGGTLAQRRDFAGQGRRMLLLLPLAGAGGIAGALFLLRTSEATFENLVPVLVLAACALLAVQDRIRAVLQRRIAKVSLGWAAVPVVIAAVYGGYFGAGLGVMYLAMIGLAIEDTLTRLNALKQMMSLVTNVVAALVFIASGPVVWPAAAAIAVGAVGGGAAGGSLASRVKPATLRLIVIFIGFAIAIVFMVRR